MRFALLVCCCLLVSKPAGRAEAGFRVASFSTVLSEVAERVGGEHVTVAALVKPGIDPHEYQPTPGDLAQASDARLILISGKGLENYLDKIEQVTGGKVEVLAVGDQLPSLTLRPGDQTGSAGAPALDPHWWNSVPNMIRAAGVVADGFARLDPAHAADYERNASAYRADLSALDKELRRKITQLPRDRRILVTSHDAFQYFAATYGFTIASIEGVSTETEPSNKHVSELIEEIKRRGVKAIFLESTLNPKVSREITRETGATIGGTLYADGLGEADAATYAGMMRHNVDTIVDGLK
ncbi:MAG: zinc ABC transporter substrate-binding protein [Verrucomicrobia bacterium]|nr:zinc ABC transporter substrate-binding protein [Verrucomicrobiota bacterium]